MTAHQLAALLGGTIEGDPEASASAPAKIEEATPGTIAFLANEKYEPFAYTTGASILLVSNDFLPQKPVAATLLRVENVRDAVAFLLQNFEKKTVPTAGISSLAFISPEAKLGAGVSVGEFAVIENGAEIGDGAILEAQVFIGKNARIGSNTRLSTGVKIMHDCLVGDDCFIQPGTIIGSDGFGFAPQADGSWKKMPQVGNVVIENGVEIGSNCTIDRATMGSTVVRTGAKLDNLIQIAHNVEIGPNTVIAAQVGVAGSTKIGANCQFGGQVGVVGHVQIADGTRVQAQSGIAAAVKEPGTALYGSPAIGYGDFQRSFVVFKQLPDLAKRVRDLEKKLAELGGK